MAKYQSSSDEATKEGNGGKARRMGRIVKQYKDAIRAHKLSKPVNLDELPVPPGFPPIPGNFLELRNPNKIYMFIMSNTLLILSAVLRKSMTNNENLGKVGHFI